MQEQRCSVSAWCQPRFFEATIPYHTRGTEPRARGFLGRVGRLFYNKNIIIADSATRLHLADSTSPLLVDAGIGCVRAVLWLLGSRYDACFLLRFRKRSVTMVESDNLLYK